MRSAPVGQNLTAASISARRSSDGVSSRISSTPLFDTANTPGASDSHTPWPWHSTRSTTTRTGTASRLAPLVAGGARLGQLHDHLGVVVAVRVGVEAER